jgi:hypothetical protein
LLPDEDGEGVFENAALNLGVDLLGLAVQQLRLGGHDIGFGGHAEVIAIFRDLERLLLGLDDVVQNVLQLILGAQRKVVDRQFALCR